MELKRLFQLTLYSVRSDRTGLALAALTACQLMVRTATPSAIAPASMNTSGPIFIL